MLFSDWLAAVCQKHAKPSEDHPRSGIEPGTLYEVTLPHRVAHGDSASVNALMTLSSLRSLKRAVLTDSSGCRLPAALVLNGSKVSDGEREDAERFFIRYCQDWPEQELPERYGTAKSTHTLLR